MNDPATQLLIEQSRAVSLKDQIIAYWRNRDQWLDKLIKEGCQTEAEGLRLERALIDLRRLVLLERITQATSFDLVTPDLSGPEHPNCSCTEDEGD